MKVLFTETFLKQVRALPNILQEHLDVCLHVLSKDPFYPSLHTKKLKGELKHMLSFRVSRDWRVIFMFIASDKIKLFKIGNRKDIYR